VDKSTKGSQKTDFWFFSQKSGLSLIAYKQLHSIFD